MTPARIMIVEDNLLVAEDLKTTLIRLGYHVAAIAKSGEQALMAAEKQVLDMVLMDLQLGAGMNGIDTAAVLRKKYQYPVIFLTAYADEETIRRAKVVEPHGYIVKPFDEKELKSTIEVSLYKQQSELKIIESRQWLQTTLKSIGDGVITTDHKGSVVFMNPLAERLTGWPEAEAIGKPMNTIIQLENEETGQVMEDPVARILREKIVVELANHTLLVTRDGKKIPIAPSGAPIKDEKGQLMGVVLVFRDQTEERRAQNALKEKSHALGERVKELNCFFNISSLTSTPDISLEDLIQGITDLIPPSWQYPEITCARILLDGKEYKTANFKETKWKQYAEISVNNENIGSLEIFYLKEMPEEDEGPFLKEERNLIDAVSKRLRDIIEKKQAEEEKKKLEIQLRQAQKLESIGNLAGGIAHDFNNILSSVIGFTELAIDDVEKGTKIEDYLQEVYSAGKRAKDLVRQILAFARQSEEETKPIRIDTIVKEVLHFIRSTIPTTIEIKQRILSNSLIMGNPIQVHQILMNLCTNAAYAMEDRGGILDVSLKDLAIENAEQKNKLDLNHGSYIEIGVSDTGTGIPADIIASVFEPYFTTKRPGEGTGMGLAMVHGIVESYGGRIMVDSTLGKGTVFRVYLPITRKRKDDCGYEQRALPTGMERILLVDDEAPIAKMGSQILERLGYLVTTRTSSVEAIELFRSKSNDFDLIITDMTMPNMTGDELAVELMDIRPDIPVILCSGYSKKISDNMAEEIGIKAFVYKPIVKSDLAKIVRKVLDEAGESGA